MSDRDKNVSRRGFLKATSLAATGGLLLGSDALASKFANDSLQVWSCGGLAEAFIPANKAYEEMTGCRIDYSGAFAAALGKSLLGSAQTEVFAPRVVELARKLKAQGKMLHFVPLCFTKYVLVTPKGNPAGVKSIKDLGKPGIKTVLSPDASPPGGKASFIILKKAGVLEQAQKNAVAVGDCVQKMVPDVISGKGDVAVMELRMTKKPEFAGKMEIIDIAEEFIPPPPVPFVIGPLKFAHNKDLAEDFVKFITSEKGRPFFEAAGFIHAFSSEGERLTKKYRINDA